MSSLSSCTQPSLPMFTPPGGGGGGGGAPSNETNNNNTLAVTMTPPISTKFAHNQRIAMGVNGGGKGDKGKILTRFITRPITKK